MYKDNHDGTFSVQAWELNFFGRILNRYVYSQEVLLDLMGDLAIPPFEANMVWLKRNHRPAMGTEI